VGRLGGRRKKPPEGCGELPPTPGQTPGQGLCLPRQQLGQRTLEHTPSTESVGPEYPPSPGGPLPPPLLPYSGAWSRPSSRDSLASFGALPPSPSWRRVPGVWGAEGEGSRLAQQQPVGQPSELPAWIVAIISGATPTMLASLLADPAGGAPSDKSSGEEDNADSFNDAGSVGSAASESSSRSEARSHASRTSANTRTSGKSGATALTSASCAAALASLQATYRTMVAVEDTTGHVSASASTRGSGRSGGSAEREAEAGGGGALRRSTSDERSPARRSESPDESGRHSRVRFGHRTREEMIREAARREMSRRKRGERGERGERGGGAARAHPAESDAARDAKALQQWSSEAEPPEPAPMSTQQMLEAAELMAEYANAAGAAARARRRRGAPQSPQSRSPLRPQPRPAAAAALPPRPAAAMAAAPCGSGEAAWSASQVAVTRRAPPPTASEGEFGGRNTTETRPPLDDEGERNSYVSIPAPAPPAESSSSRPAPTAEGEGQCIIS